MGRTGAWIVLDAQFDRMLSGVRSIDVYCQVTCLRAQRNYMVQTQDQYVFCYDALLEIVQGGFPGVPLAEYTSVLVFSLLLISTVSLHHMT